MHGEVLIGANGAGKTNLLEAISFLAPGRGLRRARMQDVTRSDAPVDETLVRCAGRWHLRWDQSVEPLRSALGSRAAGRGRRRPPGRPDQQYKYPQPVGLSEILAVVWLVPDMDRLYG